MQPTTNLNRKEHEVISTLDNIVIINALGDIPGGRTLDVSEIHDDVKVIKAGHILIMKDGVVKPLGVNSDATAYSSLPAGHSYLGVLKATISVKDPRAAIVTIGQINAAASPYPVTDAIKKGLPNIQFLYS